MIPVRTLFVSVSVLAAGLAPPLPAQTEAAVIPAPQIVIDTVGPDGWRTRLGPTNLGGMLESQAGRALWEPGVLPLLGDWQGLVGDQAEFAAMRARILGFGGRVRVGLWFAEPRPRGTFARAAVALEPDGTSDLAALATDLRTMQGHLHGEWRRLELGGEQQDVRVHGDDAMAAPIVAGSRLLLVLAPTTELEAMLAVARSFADTGAGTTLPPKSPALRLEVDVAAMVAMARAADASDWPWMRALGFDSLQKATLTVGTAGPRIQLEVAQQFDGAPRGLFAALCPPTGPLSELQALAPADAANWKVGRFDVRALWSALLDAVLAADVAAVSTRAELDAELLDELGIDLDSDLLQHATDELLLIGSPLRGLDRPREITWAMAVRLRDAARFAQGLRTMLAKVNPVVTRAETTMVGEVELHRYGNMLGYDLWLAVGNGLFVMAGGRDAEEQAGTLLAAAAAPAGTARPAPAGAAFTELQRFLPPGHNGIGRGDLHDLLGMPSEWWMLFVGDLLPLRHARRPADSEDDDEQREAVRALLRQHQLDTVRTATGHAERTWRWRLWW